ncbi:DUF4113 domain-containing protein [Klebsiella pneumoniae]
MPSIGLTAPVRAAFFAGQGINVGFAMRREMLSPEYTTDWNALPRAFMR